MIALLNYSIFVIINTHYISINNAMNELHPKDDDDKQDVSYWNILNPIFFIKDYLSK